MTSEENLIQIRKFLQEIADDPLDNFQLKVLHFVLDHGEVQGEISHWVLEYLIYRNCPNAAVSLIGKLMINYMEKRWFESPPDSVHCNETGNCYPQDLKKHFLLWLRQFCENLRTSDKLDNVLRACNSLPNVPSFVMGSFQSVRRSSSMEDSLYAIFDGYEGYQAASYTASQLPLRIAKHRHLAEHPILALRHSFRVTDEKLQSHKIESGTSATIVLHDIIEKKFIISWVGNSQAILIRDGKVRKLVDRHTLDDLDERKRILRDVAKFSEVDIENARLNGKIPVTRSIGDYEHTKIILPNPDSIVLKIDKNDDFLVLATEGLWKYTNPYEVTLAVYTHFHYNNDGMSNIIGNLTTLALNNKCACDITIMVVLLRDPSLVSTMKWLFVDAPSSSDSNPTKRDNSHDDESDQQRDSKRRKGNDDQNNSGAQHQDHENAMQLQAPVLGYEFDVELSETQLSINNLRLDDSQMEKITKNKSKIQGAISEIVDKSDDESRNSYTRMLLKDAMNEEPIDEKNFSDSCVDKKSRPLFLNRAKNDVLMAGAEQDYVISQSPQKCSNVMDDIEIPSEKEFDVEISHCPSQVKESELNDICFTDETYHREEEACVNGMVVRLCVENPKPNFNDTHDLNKIQNLPIDDGDVINESSSSDRIVLEMSPNPEQQIKSTGAKSGKFCEIKKKISDKKTVENFKGKIQLNTSSELKNNPMRTKTGTYIVSRNSDTQNKTLTPPTTNKSKIEMKPSTVDSKNKTLIPPTANRNKIEMKPSTGAIPRKPIPKVDSVKSGYASNIRTNFTKSCTTAKSSAPVIMTTAKSRASLEAVARKSFSPNTQSTTLLNKSITTVTADSTVRITAGKINSTISERVSVGKRTVSWKSPGKALSNIATSNTTNTITSRRSPAKPDISVPISNEKTSSKISSKKSTKSSSISVSAPNKTMSKNTGKLILRKSLEKSDITLNEVSTNIIGEVSLRKSPEKSINKSSTPPTATDKKSAYKENKKK